MLKKFLAILLTVSLLAAAVCFAEGGAPVGGEETPIVSGASESPKPQSPAAQSGTGGDAAGTGGDAVGTGGDAAGTGGDTAGTGGDTAGTGGDTAGTGGDTAGTGGDTAGTGGDTAGTGGDAAGTGGDAAGTGGDAAGTGGDAAGTGGDAAGTGGDAAGTGGDAAGTGSEPPTNVSRPAEGDEAWLPSPTGAEGEILSGKLEDILTQCGEAGGECTIYICTDALIAAKGFSTADLTGIAFLPDPVLYEEDKYVVQVSDTDPTAISAVEEGGQDLPADLVLYVWVEQKTAPEPTDPTDPVDPVEVEISVSEQGYQAGAWSNAEPVFTLSGIPEGETGYVYAAILYDERFVVLSGDTFTARDEGEYTLRFAILDGFGDVISMSAKYTMCLDFTPPAYLSAQPTSYTTFEVSAVDELSGLEGVSIDGGATWIPLADGEISLQTAQSGAVFPAGTIQAMDRAGNILEMAEEMAMPVPEPVYPSGGGGGGGGGSGEKKFVHAKPGEAEPVNPYNALELTVSEEPMTTLNMGGTELPLTLTLSEAENFEIGALYRPSFTAQLLKWGAGTEELAEQTPDTLMLTVQVDPAITGEYSYLWQFNGLVYKMLLNSGIDYLVFREGDHVVAMSTAGFTAGTEYTRLKAAGVSTRKFEYSVWQRGSKLDAQVREMEMEVEVGEEDVYPLNGDTTRQMYYYDVYSGPVEMLDVPFGTWTPPEEQN